MTAAKTPTLTELRKTLRVSTISKRNGVYTARKEFFYTNGYTASMLADKIRAAYPAAKILETAEIWKPFRGGASTANSSHWLVRFTLDGTAVLPE